MVDLPKSLSTEQLWMINETTSPSKMLLQIYVKRIPYCCKRFPGILPVRLLASSPSNGDGEDGISDNPVSVGHAGTWRKEQLKRLEGKFQNSNVTTIEKEDDLQPEWKNMEKRVLMRKSRTKDQIGGKSGRSNVRPTDEDSWLDAGLYQDEENATCGKKND